MKDYIMENIQEHIIISRLIAKERLGLLSPKEHERLQHWLAQSVDNKQLYEAIKSDVQQGLKDTTVADETEQWWADFNQVKLGKEPKRFRIHVWSYAAAAAILLVVGSYLMYPRLAGNNPQEIVQQIKRVEAPIKKQYKGVVLLSDDESRELLAEGGDQETVYDLNNLLTDNAATETRVEGKPKMNTLIIPRGAEFKVRLPDGTIAWLNSESKLSFPSRFTGGNREIAIEGEVCLDVFHDAAQPFIVHTPKQRVTVLGTLFNVEAYTGRNTVTTLVRGKVEVDFNNQKILLKPNEQLVALPDGSVRKQQVDANERIQWTKGRFEFTDVKLDDIMLKLSRWYDVSYAFISPEAKNARFTLQLERDESLQSLLDKIEQTGRVRFQISGKHVRITE